MQELKRFHYHHADGVVLGGHIERPFEELIPVHASLSLPPTGGHVTSSPGGFQYREVISYTAAHVQVSGSSVHKDGPWTTLVTATVEGLNLLNVVTADRVVARISTEHPAEGYHPKVSFVGTQFEGLRVGGCDVKIDLDLDLCKTATGDGYPPLACIDDPGFLERVNRQRAVFIEEKRRHESLGNKVSDFVTRHASDYSDGRHQKSGHVLCSLVSQITVDESRKKCPGKRLGHIIDLPDVGKLYLAELVATNGHYQLIMLRSELGCPVAGGTSVVTARINGSTGP
jgi:hypothetical protein